MAKKQGGGGSRRGQQPTGNIKAAKPAVALPAHIQATVQKRQAQKAGLRKTASGLGASMAAPSVIRNIPKVYSPLYEMTNLMLPRDQKTLNAWNRHFFTTNPIVRNAVTLHATYPISKFNISCEDPKVKQFFEDMFDRMNFRGLLLSTSLEYWKLGERLDGDTLITLENGAVKRVADVQVGDRVITHKGRTKTVTAVMKKLTAAPDEDGNNVKVYKVKVVDLDEPLIITGNHPIYSKEYAIDNQFEFTKTKDIGQSSQIAILNTQDRSIGSTTLEKIEDITDQYAQEYMYDLEVEGDHSYVANGIVVHNCFPYLELDEDNGVWDYGFLHNPDFVRVKYSPLTRDPVFGLVPDDSLRRVVQGMSPVDAALKSQLDPEIANFVQKGMDIPLENFNISHLKMLAADYDQRGTSLITSVYKDLMLYDKIREAQFAQADNMINPLTLVKLGDPTGTWKPSDDDIRAFQEIIEEAQYDPDFKLITHGAVNVERIGYSGSTLDVSQMWEAINRNIYTGLLAPEAILNGEGPNYSTAAIGLEVLRTRYERFREQMSEWIEKKVMEPICKLQDFYKREGGDKKYICPKVIWNKMNLRDLDSYVANMIGLLATQEAAGKVSDETLFEVLDIDYLEEQKQMRREMIDRTIAAQEAQILTKMTLEELRALDPDKPIRDLHPEIELPTSAETEEGGEGGLPEIPGLPGGGGGPEMGGGEEGGLPPIAPEGGPPGGGEGAPPAPPAGEGPGLP